MPTNMRTHTLRALLRSTVGMKAVMATTGAIALLLFLLVHIPQMTTGFLHLQFRAGDDYGNVVHVFRVWWVTPLYLAALAALGLHLYHGTWSALRTLGVSGRRAFPLRRPAVATLAALVALGFASIPLAVALGVLSAPPPAVAAAR